MVNVSFRSQSNYLETCSRIFLLLVKLLLTEDQGSYSGFGSKMSCRCDHRVQSQIASSPMLVLTYKCCLLHLSCVLSTLESFTVTSTLNDEKQSVALEKSVMLDQKEMQYDRCSSLRLCLQTNEAQTFPSPVTLDLELLSLVDN